MLTLNNVQRVRGFEALNSKHMSSPKPSLKEQRSRQQTDKHLYFQKDQGQQAIALMFVHKPQYGYQTATSFYFNT